MRSAFGSLTLGPSKVGVAWWVPLRAPPLTLALKFFSQDGGNGVCKEPPMLVRRGFFSSKQKFKCKNKDS